MDTIVGAGLWRVLYGNDMAARGGGHAGDARDANYPLPSLYWLPMITAADTASATAADIASGTALDAVSDFASDFASGFALDVVPDVASGVPSVATFVAAPDACSDAAAVAISAAASTATLVVTPVATRVATPDASSHAVPASHHRCPAPMERAPRYAGTTDNGAVDRLYPAPPALQGVLSVLIRRDTRGLPLSDAQRLSHFPASPLVTLSWYHGLDAGLVGMGAAGPVWQPFGSRVVLSGSQSQPSTSWAPTTGRGYMACFPADVARALFGIDMAAVHDRFVPAADVLDAGWAPLFAELLRAPDDAAAMAALERHLVQRWRAVASSGPGSGMDDLSPLASVRRLGRHWVERLALQAHAWRRDVGPRHVERRIKSYSGRSLRQWQALVRTEGLFFAARDRYESGTPFNWAELALDEGFSDQAHMTRVARQVTGFPPGEFAQRFIEDEAFWMYRLWV